MGSRLATWSLSGVQSEAWRVYSSLTLHDNQTITTVDCKSGKVESYTLFLFVLHKLGLLAIGTPSSLSVYTLILENDLPTWSLKWSLPYVAAQSRYNSINEFCCQRIAGLSRVRFSPSLMYIASTTMVCPSMFMRRSETDE